MASRSQRKKQYLTQQAGKQKELRQLNAGEYRPAIEAAVRKELPQIIQSVIVEEQSVHIGPLPPADEAKKYQELCPDFVDRTLGIAERGQILQAMHSNLALLMAGGIVLAALRWSYNLMIVVDKVIIESLSPFLATVATLAGAFYGAKKINERSNPQRKKREED